MWDCQASRLSKKKSVLMIGGDWGGAKLGGGDQLGGWVLGLTIDPGCPLASDGEANAAPSRSRLCDKRRNERAVIGRENGKLSDRLENFNSKHKN